MWLSLWNGIENSNSHEKLSHIIYEPFYSCLTTSKLLLFGLQISIYWSWVITQKTSVQVCQWILYRSSFKPDVICYNLLIDAFGQKLLYKEAESTYLQLLEAHCIPTEDTYALLIKAYCLSGLLGKAEAVFAEMRNYGLPSSMFLNQLIPYISWKWCVIKDFNTWKIY